MIVMCLATPAIVGYKLLIRTDSQIYCISGEVKETKEPKKEAKITPGVIQLCKYFSDVFRFDLFDSNSFISGVFCVRANGVLTAS